MRFEYIPALLSWGTLIVLTLASWKLPIFVAVGIILFDTYWVAKTIYLTIHLRSAYKAMRANLAVDWIKELQELVRDANNTNDMRMPQIIEKDLSYRVGGLLFRAHNQLGRYAKERQYGDVLEKELIDAKLNYRREAPLKVADRKSDFVDFIIEDRIALELKVKSFTTKEDYYQIQRYLRDANLKLGLLVNFRERYLKPKRVINSTAPDSNSFVDSHEFVDRHRVLQDWQRVQHLVLLPMYKEPYEVVKETLDTIAASDFPLENIRIVLGLEERAGGIAQEVGDRIRKEYADRFGGFIVTTHPANLPGEIPGKGSNEAWMAAQALKAWHTNKHESVTNVHESNTNDPNLKPDSSLHPIPYTLHPSRTLVSVFDVDTQVPPGFFSRLTYLYLTTPDPDRAIYQPIPLFSNNIYQAPALARVIALSCTFWQMMQQARPDKLTSFSSQSIPLSALRDIGFWHTDVVSEDSRIFWQCLIHYRGNFRVVPMLYPISMDINAADSFWRTLVNLYKQQRRWAWGVENTPYLLRQFKKHPEIPASTRRYWSFHVLQGFHSWATNSLIIFALGWLPVVLGGRAFNYMLMSYNLPRVTQYIIGVSMIGIASCAVLGVLLLPPRPKWFRFRHYFAYLFQWLLIPLVLIVFGSIPALEAQTRLALGGRFRLGFWVTPKSRM